MNAQCAEALRSIDANVTALVVMFVSFLVAWAIRGLSK